MAWLFWASFEFRSARTFPQAWFYDSNGCSERKLVTRSTPTQLGRMRFWAESCLADSMRSNSRLQQSHYKRAPLLERVVIDRIITCERSTLDER